MAMYERLRKLRVGDAARMNALLTQLRGSPYQRSATEYARILRQKNLRKLVARDIRGSIVGMATLYIEDTDAGRIAHVADVIVDETHRRQGIGEELNRRLIALARAHDADFLELSSGPSRHAAHMLYQKLGYQKRDTYVFRITLK